MQSYLNLRNLSSCLISAIRSFIEKLLLSFNDLHSVQTIEIHQLLSDLVLTMRSVGLRAVMAFEIRTLNPH